MCALAVFGVCSSGLGQTSDDAMPLPVAPAVVPRTQQLSGSTHQQVRLYVLPAHAISQQIANLLPNRYRLRDAGTKQIGATLLGRFGRTAVTLSGAANSPSVILTGEPRLVAQLASLIRALDQNEASHTKSIVFRRTVAALSTGSATPTSHSLVPTQRQNMILPVQYVQLAQATQPLGNEGVGQLDPATRQRLRDLGDDVQVEVLPDLDVVILRGRDRDIDELARIIKRLEEMAVGAQPSIEVYQLKHVPGESLAELISGVADDYTGPRQGRVSVTALGKPNALLVVGWGSALQATLELIAKLDKPVAPQTQLDIIPLRHAAAGQAAQTLQDFFAARTGLGPKVLVTPDQRTNSLIINAAPRDIQEVRRMIEQLDTSQTDSVNRAKVFRLQHALAADIATVLQGAITNSQSQDANTRAAALEFLAGDADSPRMLRSGDLANVQITPSPRTNSLIVTGPPATVEVVAALIRHLDLPRDAAQIKVFRIVNGDAANLVQVLRSLLLANGGGAATSTGGGSLGLPNAEGESSLTPLRFSVEDRTNSIIAVGPKGDLEIVGALLARLDEEGSNERTNAVYHLKNAPATDVARTINEFLRSERLLDQAAQGAVSATQLTSREVIVVPEVVSNKLVLSATPQYFAQLQDLIHRLDEPPPQVMIQVLIGEVQLSTVDEFGIEVGLQNSVLFDRSLLGDLQTLTTTSQESTADGVVTVTEQIIQAATNTPGFNFNNETLGNSGSTAALAGAHIVGGQGLGSFGVGRTNSELGFGGLVLSASSESISVLVRALEESRRLEVLSRPQIRTLDNQPAFIQVGQVVPFILNSTITQFGQTNSVDFRDVGLILGVTPRISPDGTVVMEIDAEKSTVGPEEQGIPIAATQDGTIIRSPSIETTRAQTTVSAASGETIVLGGLITKSNATTQRGVPYISDIPVVGDLFKYENTSVRRTELLIILTPHVIRNAEDNERIKQMEMARMSWCTADIYDMHGDVNYHFPADNLDLDAPTREIYPDADPTGASGVPRPNDLQSRLILQGAGSQPARPANAGNRNVASPDIR